MSEFDNGFRRAQRDYDNALPPEPYEHGGPDDEPESEDAEGVLPEDSLRAASTVGPLTATELEALADLWRHMDVCMQCKVAALTCSPSEMCVEGEGRSGAVLELRRRGK